MSSEISEGSILGKHYKIEAFLGEGTFGVVAKCRNTKNNKTMAIKINKSKPEILQQAKLEMFILENLRRLDADTCNIVKWNDFFLHEEHICLNFELLDQNLWDYIKDRNHQGLPIRELRPILHQLSNALYHIGSLGIVHADLKPGNIMVVNRHESPIKVKVIDFGLAHPVSAVIPGTCVQTIWYRAPEVMLHIPYNQAIDMWSLGLVAVELAIGVPLYPGKMDYDVLKFITDIQGQPPDYILDCGFATEYYFRKNNHREQRWTFKAEEQFLYETGYQSKDTRHIRLQHLDDLKQLITVRTGPESGTDLLVSLIKQMLALDANQRIKPLEVLKHPFFDPGLSKSSSCIKMSSRGGQNLVVSQQPSNWKREGPDKINCSFHNSGELAQQEHLNMSANKSFLQDDREISEGSILGKHYKIEAFLGEGTFGVVAKCRNTKNNKTMAIKINKSKPEILQQAKLEMFILEKLRRLDADTCNIVKWNDSFLHGERICLNFELLDQNLWDYIKDRNYQGLPIRELRPILHQLSNALYHIGSLGIVHADLKPGNIMVVNRHESPVKVKVIDFGLAHPVSAVIPGTCVQTIWYRAPEVMLHIPYNQAIDMWSLGLVAVELAIGVPFYPGKMDYDVLKFITDTQGQPPDYILDCGFATEYYFRKNNHREQHWTFKTAEQFLYETGYQSKDTRHITLQHLDDLKQVITVRTGPESGTDLLVSLIKQMLALDANQRIKPLEVLKHPFFDPGLSKSSPCVKMSSRGGQNLVVSQQPSNGKRERPDKINCSFKNSGELAQQEHLNVSANKSFLQDDREISEGSIIGKYFKVEAFLGEGTFGVVAKCRNIKNNKTVAIKINKSKPEILQQAKLELRILKKLQSLDADTCNIVKWNDSFVHGERICLNFELLDQNLWDYIKDRNHQGLPIRELRSILHQLSNALYHIGSLGIVHADLKPGNTMVVNRHESPVKVKVIDFGLAHPVSEVIPGACVQTIWYRAPEVMLHIPYNEAIDMWSLGLVAVELAIGVPLYPGKMDYDVLNFIINTQGQPPEHILDCGMATEYYFRKNDHSKQRWTFKTEKQFLYETGYQSKDTRCIRLQHLDDLKQVITVRTGPESGTDLLVSLIKRMLALDPNQRIQPLEVLRHPFFDPGLRVSQALE